ncbi:MAG: hypothetical protein JKY48_20340, partial [Flavobacteriales bacterium]|nr:hypothetical protein [Flavobacteriales bacterium]
TQAITDFGLAFPSASIEEDAVMFSSFVNEMYGTSLNYYSIITFKNLCDSLAGGGIITDGFTEEALDFLVILNDLVLDGFTTETTYGDDYIPLPSYFNSSFHTCDDEALPFVHSTYVDPSSGKLSFRLGTNIGVAPYCDFCPKGSITFEAETFGGWLPIEVYDHIIEFTGIYLTASDLATGPPPAITEFHLTALVEDPADGEPIEINILVSNNCFSVFGGNILCGNYVPEIEDDCVDALIASAEMEAEAEYGEYLATMKEQFVTDYIESCRGVEEEYNYSYLANRYHHTLAYYDRAGNLVKTVPPKGIVGLASTEINEVQLDRAGAVGGVPHVNNHSFVTNYYYNALNQPIQTVTPDGGTSNFWYDDLARLVVSQNAKQANDLTAEVIAGDPLSGITPTQAYSYSRFDELGRPIEMGEFVQPTDITKAIAKNPLSLFTWLNQSGVGRYRNQVTRIGYSDPTSTDALAEFGATEQGDIRNRVSSISTVQGYVQMLGPWTFPIPDYLNHYAYDVHGNVTTHLQENTDLVADGRQFFRSDYEYDLLTGIPHYSHFQKGKIDQFSHRYEYDADNRLKEVYTSKDGCIWDRDAEYTYRLDGKLARTELGELQVQGMDKAYTLQGWIKAMNSTVLDPLKDMGKDGRQFIGSLASLSSQVAQDALAFTLGYYETDYKSIDTDPSNQFLGTSIGTAFGMDHNALFNGNISSTTTAMMDLEENPINVTGTAYRYDQLHRLKETHVFSATDITALNSFVNADRQNLTASLLPGISPALGDYEVHINYDRNGNILELDRRAHDQGAVANKMDAFSYNYIDAVNNNLLGRVKDDATATTYDDIKEDQLTGNYEYYSDGTLKSDAQEEIAYLEWYPNGKLKRIFRTPSSTRPDMYFEYNPMGNRVLKVEMPKDVSGNLLPEAQWNFSWYGMDANGIPMGIYQKTETESVLHRIEASIYGSKRLGLDTRRVEILDETPLYDLDDLVEDVACGTAGSWYMNEMAGTTYSLGDVDADLETDLTITNTTLSNFRVMQTINTVIGESYTVNYEILAKTVTWIYSRAQACTGGGGTLGSLNAAATGIYSYSFTATSDQSKIYWRGWGSTGNFTLENVQITGSGDVYELEGAPSYHHRIIGEKMYELGDHLGNVKEVITDRKIVEPVEVSILNSFVEGNPCGVAGTWFLNQYPGTTHALSDFDADGEMDLTLGHLTTSFMGVLTINTEIGETYTVSYDILDQTTTWVYGRAKTCPGGGTVIGMHNAPAVGSYSYIFIATTAQTKISWNGQGIPPGGGSFTLGNISITGAGDIFGSGGSSLLALLPDIVSFKDYYPFGMEMPGRKGALSGAQGYRYAFNGMEQDQEVSGSGNSYTTMFRQYDPRLGRWKSLDPLASKYPGASPFSAYNNNPIYFVDPLGLEGLIYDGEDPKSDNKTTAVAKEGDTHSNNRPGPAILIINWVDHETGKIVDEPEFIENPTGYQLKQYGIDKNEYGPNEVIETWFYKDTKYQKEPGLAGLYHQPVNPDPMSNETIVKSRQ